MSKVYNDEIDKQSNTFFTFFVIIMVYFTYFLSAFTKPYQSNLDNALNQTLIPEGSVFELNSADYPTSCQFCRMRKHERSSHCSTCDNCVLKRDHHCTFIGNCVGYGNTRFFLNFLVWMIVKKFV